MNFAIPSFQILFHNRHRPPLDRHHWSECVPWDAPGAHEAPHVLAAFIPPRGRPPSLVKQTAQHSMEHLIPLWGKPATVESLLP